MITRTKKAFYNITTEALMEIVAFVCALILPRLILSTFGSAYNGLVSSITQFLDYISLLTLGISGAVRVSIYKAKDDIKAKSAIVKASEKYLRKVAYAFVAYIAVLSVIYPLFVRDEFQWLETVSLIVIIGFGVFAKYFYGVAIKAFLSAEQSNYVWNIVQIFSQIASTGISVLLILLGQSIQVVKFGSAIILVATPLIVNVFTKKKFHLITDVEPDNKALGMRKDVVAHSIANCVHTYTDIFLLTLFTSPATISVYAIYALVFSSIKKIQNVFTTGMEGAFGTLWAQGKYKQYRENFNTYEFLCFAFVSIMFPCVGMLLLSFIRLYTNGVHDVNYILPVFAYLSVITHGVFCLRTPYLTAVQSAGHYRETKKYAFIEAGLNFGISAAAVLVNGLVGVTLGTLVANLYRTGQYAIYASRNLLDRSLRVFIRRCLWLFLNIMAIVTLRLLLPTVPINTWSRWVINGFYCFFISSAVTAVTAFLFYQEDLKCSIQVIGKMFNKKQEIK